MSSRSWSLNVSPRITRRSRVFLSRAGPTTIHCSGHQVPGAKTFFFTLLWTVCCSIDWLRRVMISAPLACCPDCSGPSACSATGSSVTALCWTRWTNVEPAYGCA